MDGQRIARRRMRGQHLWGRALATPEQVVGSLGAMQAQLYDLAKWSVAQRTQGTDHAAVERAVAEGTILRTHVLRPTWHFVLPSDIRWMLALTGPRVKAKSASGYRRLGLDARTLARSNRVLERAVGGEHRTRGELLMILERAGIDAAGQRMPYLLMNAELDAVLCSGAPRGKQHTYALLEERVPAAPSLERDEALAELVRRYFTCHGPATLKDFAWWSSLTIADGKRGLEMVGSELRREVVDGRVYWLASASTGQRPRPAAVDLVQIYDEVVVAYTESRDVVQGSVARPVLEIGGGMLHPLLIDGRLAGGWTRVVRGGRVLVEAHPARPLDAGEERGLRRAAERYGRFLGLSAEARIRAL